MIVDEYIRTDCIELRLLFWRKADGGRGGGAAWCPVSVLSFFLNVNGNLFYRSKH